MPKLKQTPEAHAAVRARLIGIAREIYSLEGPEAVSMRALGRRAGYSTAALYRYFADHDALVRAMWRDAVERLGESIAEAGAGQQDPLRRIRAILAAYADFAARDSSAFRASFLQLSRPGPNPRGRSGSLCPDPVGDHPWCRGLGSDHRRFPVRRPRAARDRGDRDRDPRHCALTAALRRRQFPYGMACPE